MINMTPVIKEIIKLNYITTKRGIELDIECILDSIIYNCEHIKELLNRVDMRKKNWIIEHLSLLKINVNELSKEITEMRD